VSSWAYIVKTFLCFLYQLQKNFVTDLGDTRHNRLTWLDDEKDKRWKSRFWS